MSSKLVLHVWPAKWDLPSIGPSCITAILYLQSAIPGQFHISECTNPDLSPTGQLPFLTHLHHSIAPLPSIIKYISARSSEKDSTPNLDISLNPSEKSQSYAWCAHAESNLGDLVSHMLYSLNANWSRLTLPTLANMIPLPQRYYVPKRIRESYKPRLEAADLWNLPGIEQEVEKPKFGEKPKEKDHKDEFKMVFEREKVLEKAKSIFDIYTRLLGSKTFFFGSKPTTLDIYVSSHILILLNPPFPDPLLQSLLQSSYPNLTAHAQLVLSTILPTNNIPHIPATSYSLSSVFPPMRSGGGGGKKIKGTEKTNDEIRFERMRWGWIGLAILSAGFYVVQSGVIGTMREVIARQQEEEDEDDEEEEE